MVGLAVIGLGAIGRFHAETLARHVPDARLVMVVDPVAGLAERVAGELGVRASTSADEALRDPGVAAVVVAAPTPLHAGLIEAAAAAGVHVFCEKPLGVELGAVERAVRAAREAGVRLQVGFQRRFEEAFVAAKRGIDSGELGTIQLLRLAHRNRTPPHDGDLTDRLGSIFVDMTVHDFDTARWLVGDIAEVHAFQRTRNTVTVLHFANGGMGVIDNSRFAGYGFECSAEIVGTGSSLRIGAGIQADDNFERHEPAYREELREFVACVANGHDPAVGGDDALAALRLALAAERSVA
jgi:myo-inositol 2-dehydrogenase / D-chiro-inositol 1-dehydrogenase